MVARGMGNKVQIRIIFCEKCDQTKYPIEPIVWEGRCHSCKKDMAKIIIFDIPDSEKPVLKEIK